MATILKTTATLLNGSVIAGVSNNYWLPGTVGGSNADATDVLGRVRAAWLAMAANMSTGTFVSFSGECLLYNDSNGDLVGAVVGIPGATVAGSNATGDLMPLQTQGLIQWNTAGVVHSRRVRGHTYLPFSVESNNTTGGAPTGTYVTAIAAFGSAMLGSGATASTGVVWHRPGPAGAGSSFQINGAVARSAWAVLRSRR